MSFLFDSNVLIYALAGGSRKSNSGELMLHRDPAISAITWMEVMIGSTPDTEKSDRLFLGRFRVIETSREVAESAVQIRRRSKMKLPDAIIYATALVSGRILVTFNTRDFPVSLPQVLIPTWE